MWQQSAFNFLLGLRTIKLVCRVDGFEFQSLRVLGTLNISFVRAVCVSLT